MFATRRNEKSSLQLLAGSDKFAFGSPGAVGAENTELLSKRGTVGDDALPPIVTLGLLRVCSAMVTFEEALFTTCNDQSI